MKKYLILAGALMFASPLLVLGVLSYQRTPLGEMISSPVTYTVVFDESDIPQDNRCEEGPKYWALLTYNDQYGVGYCGEHCFLSETFPISELSKTFAMDLEEGVYDFWEIDFSATTPIPDTQEQPPLCGAIGGADHFVVGPSGPVSLFNQTFVRLTSEPVVERATFNSVTGGNAFLTIQPELVASAVVKFNGVVVALPENFSRKNRTIEVPVFVLAGENLVEVELRSAPGSTLIVKIVK